MQITDYISDMKIHLNRYCSEVNRSRLDEIYKDTTALIYEIDDLCSDGESAFLQSWLKTRKKPISTPLN